VHGTAQVDCELNDVLVNITTIEGATIDRGRSLIRSATPSGTSEGDTLEITADRCGEISFEVTLSYDWVNGFADDAWLHGISFLQSSGWSSGEAGTLDAGWDFYHSITGCCSGNTYFDGYFYEDSGFNEGSNCRALGSGCCGQNNFVCNALALAWPADRRVWVCND